MTISAMSEPNREQRPTEPMQSEPAAREPRAEQQDEPAERPATPRPVTPSPRTPTPRPVAKTEGTLPPKTAREMVDDFEKIIMEVNKGIQQLRRFKARHPYLIAPNIYSHWEEGLKETGLTMVRDFQRMRDLAGDDRATPAPRNPENGKDE